MEPRLVGRDIAKVPPKPTKLTKCLDDDVDVGARRFPMAPRKMAYFDLAYAHAKLCRLGKDFGIDHRPHAPDLDLFENFASE